MRTNDLSILCLMIICQICLVIIFQICLEEIEKVKVKLETKMEIVKKLKEKGLSDEEIMEIVKD